MPYQSVSDLPKAQTDQYNPHQKQAFLKAFNNAYKEWRNEPRVCGRAWQACGKKPGRVSVPVRPRPPPRSHAGFQTEGLRA
jgi:cation transport regulator